jgi:hypothetical protein
MNSYLAGFIDKDAQSLASAIQSMLKQDGISRFQGVGFDTHCHARFSFSRSHGIMPPPRHFAGRSPRALRAHAARRQTFLPAAKTEFTERTIHNSSSPESHAVCLDAYVSGMWNPQLARQRIPQNQRGFQSGMAGAFHCSSSHSPFFLLAEVVFLTAGTQVGTVLDAGPVLLTVLPVFIGFLLVVALIALGLTRWLRLPMDAGRTLALSLGTRNSFVVLPPALALPAGWETTVVVVVFQSLVELFGMVFYLWWLPRHLFKSSPAAE